MAMNALAMPAPATRHLRLVPGSVPTRQAWWERRSLMRSVVGGCPDHWWKPTAARTTACTCDRF
jgi:hypothetical protein